MRTHKSATAVRDHRWPPDSELRSLLMKPGTTYRMVADHIASETGWRPTASSVGYQRERLGLPPRRFTITPSSNDDTGQNQTSNTEDLESMSETRVANASEPEVQPSAEYPQDPCYVILPHGESALVVATAGDEKAQTAASGEARSEGIPNVLIFTPTEAASLAGELANAAVRVAYRHGRLHMVWPQADLHPTSSSQSDEIESLRLRMSTFLVGVVSSASRPVPLSSAAQMMRKKFGKVVLESHWAGYERFSTFAEEATGGLLERKHGLLLDARRRDAG